MATNLLRREGSLVGQTGAITQLVFVRTDLSFSNFSSLSEAVTAINNQTLSGTIFLPAGTIDLTSAREGAVNFIQLPNNVNIIGSGDGTVIYGKNSESSDKRPTVVPGSNSVYKDFEVLGDLTTATLEAPMGAILGAHAFTGSTFINLNLVGAGDGFYVVSTGSAFCSGTMIGCRISTKYDCFVVGGATAHSFNVLNTIMVATTGMTAFMTGVKLLSGSHNFSSCQVNVGNNRTEGQYCNGLAITPTTTGTINITGCTFSAANTNAAVVNDILIGSSTANVPGSSAPNSYNVVITGCTGRINGWYRPTDQAEHWLKAKVDFQTFIDAGGGASATVTLGSLPAGFQILASRSKTTTVFAGGSVASGSLTLGIASSNNKYGDTLNIMTAVSDTNIVATARAALESTTANTNIIAVLSTGGDTIDNLTQGAVDIWVKVAGNTK
jgi:hypothetical protein